MNNYFVIRKKQMLRLCRNIAMFSLRLKGPTTQRILLKEGKFKTEPIIEDFFA